MPDPTSQEQEPQNNKPKQSAYLVCDGALCQCTGGAAPVKLKVTSHKKAYINAEKLLATEKDVTFDQPGHFGTCSFKPPNSNACVPAVQQWMKPYKDIEVENQKALTDKSELLCSVGGKIAIKMHGQQQSVNAGQAENMDRSIAAQVNPLADLAPIAQPDKKVKVNSITGKLVDDPKYKPVTTQNTQTIQSKKDSKTDTDPTDIYVRPDQEVEFTANAEGETALVCWKVKGKEMPIYFLQHGPKYKTGFPEVGKYTIEGYGTGGDSHLDVETKVVNGEEKERKEDTACMLDILVQNNKLTGIRHLPSVNVIDKTVAGKTEAQVRIGVPITFEPVYLMAPIQEEIDHLILLIRDASGNEVQREKGKPAIVFAAQNSAAAYKVEAYFDNSDAAPFTYTFKTVNNTVSVIATSGMQKENDKIRLGKTLTFSVSKYKFSDDTLDEELLAVEHGKIKWYENSEVVVATGETYTKTYNREGKYIVKCGVTAVEKTWFTKGKDDTDDWRFEVSNNYPTAIEQKTPGKAKIGKNSYFELKGIFPINNADAATIKWQLTGPESIDTTRLSTFIFVPKKKGTYTLSATMNGRTISTTFECLACEIVKGWWTDADGNMLTGDDDDDEPSNTIGFAGWDQEVVASFKHLGLNGEDVTLEVWDSDLRSNTSVFKKDIKVSDSFTVDTCSIKLDQKIRDKVKEKGWSEDGSLYFTVKAKNGLKVINDGMVLPADNYLKIDSTVRIKMYFADNNDKRRYSTASLDTPVYVQVKSTNLIGEDLEMEIWEWGYIYHNVLGSRTPFKVDKYGMASVKLNMEDFKSKLSNPNDSIQIYVKVFNKKTGKEQQSKSGTYKLTLYKTLNETAESSDTTKAFVLVDASNMEYGSCGKKFCIKVGEKSELIREINIRLAGFGGNVPTDEFTIRTEKMIKQFQRDYMKVVETGKICGSVLKAIDEFSSKYSVDINQGKCKCGQCSGFGNGKYSEEKNDTNINEKNRKYEYPGIHRTLLWAQRAIQFYLDKIEGDLKIKVGMIFSGYRCNIDNSQHLDQNGNPRASTNHMGKALDLHIYGLSDRNNSESNANKVRDLLEKYSGAKYRWGIDNVISLEPDSRNRVGTEFIATTWVHYDVRAFDLTYLHDQYFAKSATAFNGESIVKVAKDLGLSDMCGCSLSEASKKSQGGVLGKRVDPKTLKISESGKKFIKEWEGTHIENNKHVAYDDSEGYCTIGYGNLIQEKKCSEITLPDKFKNGIQGPDRLIEKFKILKLEQDPNQKDRVLIDIHITPYFPAKSFVVKLDGQKGDDGTAWNSEYKQS